MQQQSLSLTRRGITLFHWGVGIFAGLLLLSVGLSFFMQYPIARQLLITIQQVIPYVQPVLELTMLVGVLLTCAAPAESGTQKWAYSIFLFGIFAWFLPVVVYIMQLPMGWLSFRSATILIQALLFVGLLRQLASWIKGIEASDIANRGDGVIASVIDREDAQVWTDLESRLENLFRIGCVVVGAAVLFSMYPGLALQVAMLRAGVTVIVVFFMLLLLLAMFSRNVYRFKKAMRISSARTETDDLSWRGVPADRLVPASILLGAVAALALGIEKVANYTLAPKYFMKEIERTFGKAGPFPGGSISESAFTPSPAPAMSMKPIDGEPLELNALKGKIVVLNFWATWCGPCVKEIPDLIELAEQGRDQGVIVIGISDEDETKIRNFTEKRGVKYPMVSGAGWPAPFHQINAVPTTFVIDGDGMIRSKLIGSRSLEVFQAEVEKAKKPLGQELPE
jgi:peroxiredoxin